MDVIKSEYARKSSLNLSDLSKLKYLGKMHFTKVLMDQEKIFRKKLHMSLAFGYVQSRSLVALLQG